MEIGNVERGLVLNMRDNKKGQHILGMPFEVIFAIFLIVIFIIIAFIAIGGFLDVGRSTNVGLFYEEFQKAVDDAWKSQSGLSSFEINLPTEITSICFANLSAPIKGSYQTEYQMIKNYDVYVANTFLIPPEKSQNMQWKMINHLDIENITKVQNPNCFSTNEELKIKKEFYSRFVMIE